MSSVTIMETISKAVLGAHCRVESRLTALFFSRSFRERSVIEGWHIYFLSSLDGSVTGRDNVFPVMRK